MSDVKGRSPIDGKKILFFSPAFFGYENKIKTKMTEMGASVDAFDARSVTGAYERALLKLGPALFDKKTEGYYAHIFSQVKRVPYDYVLIVKCDMPTERVLKAYRKQFKKAKLCLHMWDSVKNIPNVEKKFQYFDYISSFDRFDCLNNRLIHFRPLYYCDEYKKEQKAGASYDYDLCFIGTIHSDRWKILKDIKKQAVRRGLRMFCYPYLQSPFIYWFYKLTKPEFWDTDRKEFRFGKISGEEAAWQVARSKAVIDIQHPGQTGLTIRTIEMLGMHKKLITTNADIQNYDFYRPENIQVIDRKRPRLAGELKADYAALDEKTYEAYSLESWIYGVLGIGAEAPCSGCRAADK